MFNKKIIILSSLLTIFCFFVFVQLAAAALEPPRLQIPSPRIKIPGLDKFSEVNPKYDVENDEFYYEIPWIGEYIANLYKFGVILAAVLAFIMLMIGGFFWITAVGVPDKITLAKNIIAGAVIGLILALGSYLVLYTINPALTTFQAVKIRWIEPKVKEGKKCPAEDNTVAIPSSIAGLGISPNCSDGCRVLPETLDKLKKAAEVAAYERKTIYVTSAFRTWRRQEELYKCYKEREPSEGTAGWSCSVGCKSCNPANPPDCNTASHQSGKAIDVCIIPGDNCSNMIKSYKSEETEDLKKIMQIADLKKTTSEWWHFEDR